MLLDSHFPPDVRVENEAYSLINAGHEVHILCYSFDKKEQSSVYNGIHVHRFYISRQVSKKMLGLINLMPLYKNTWKKQIDKILASADIDAVHFHDLPICILLSYVKKNFKKKCVADMHENYPYLVASQGYMNKWWSKYIFPLGKWFENEKLWLNEADAVVCVADEMKTRLKEIIDNKIEVYTVPNTFNFNTFLINRQSVSGLKEKVAGKFVVSYIGGIDAVRGVNYLIDAAKILKSKIDNLLVLVVGGGSILPDLMQHAKSQGVEDIVVFEGHKPANQLVSFIGATDVCIIPHVRSVQTDNSSPNKLFQYMYFGKPIISSNCTSIEKIIREENCGLIFEDRNAEELAKQIQILYENGMLKQQMGENGKNAVMQKYNWDATVKPLLNLYNQ